MLRASTSGGFKAVDMTAFGETTTTTHYPLSTTHFFTGKPYIGELGYAFLFRNYRPEQGKWQTADPLGYPDGWNNLAYVNNGVIGAIDYLGAWTLWRWLYTGDGNASDSVYNEALDAAGASYYNGLQAAIAGMPVLGTALNYYGRTQSLVTWDAATVLGQAVMTDPLVSHFADTFATDLGLYVNQKKSSGSYSQTSPLLTLDTGKTFDLGSALILGKFYIQATASWTVTHVEGNKYRYSGTINYRQPLKTIF
jgi:RHS repeat-associated protein